MNAPQNVDMARAEAIRAATERATALNQRADDLASDCYAAEAALDALHNRAETARARARQAEKELIALYQTPALLPGTVEATAPKNPGQ